MKLGDLFCLLEERLVQHDNNRKDVQRQLHETCAKLLDETNALEERVNGDIHKDYDPREELVLCIIEKLGGTLPSDQEGNDMNLLVEQIKKILLVNYEYEIEQSETEDFINAYNLKVKSVNNTNIDNNMHNINKCNTSDIIKCLRDYLKKMHKSMKSAQLKMTEICNERRKKIEELETRVNEKLEPLFVQEDAHMQEVTNVIRENINSENPSELASKAKAILLINHKYVLCKSPSGKLLDNYDLVVTNEASLKCIDFEKRDFTNVSALFSDKGEISLSFTFFDDDEIKFLNPYNFLFNAIISIRRKNSNDNAERTLTKPYKFNESICFIDVLSPNTTYYLKLKLNHGIFYTKWSDETEFTTPEFNACVWKECLDEENKKYLVNENNPRIATNINECCTIIGNTALPQNKVTHWNIKVLKSKDNDANGIYTGVAPFDIDQNNSENLTECGWYFDCFYPVLHSGPPHNYKWKQYGPRKGNCGDYVHNGNGVGVVMDTTKGELSFIVDGVNLGMAFKSIPLDKPLVPCVILKYEDDSIEFNLSEVKENIDSLIPVPTNISAKSITWDSITLIWDIVKSAAFYQIEVDGSKFLGISEINEFTKRGFLAETIHTIRVRAVRGDSVSEWSEAVKGMTKEAPDFTECAWKECPDHIYTGRRYIIDSRNPRITKKMGNYSWNYCTIIGNTSLPPNRVTSWNIRVLKSKWNDGMSIQIGVAPSDIDQDADDNYNKYGWYFGCYKSTLNSGPPHNYRGREYGPRKGEGKYIHEGNFVGVVMDTVKGELSFAVNGDNLGVAYEGIPLDEPVVPCILLYWDNDSVELEV